VLVTRLSEEKAAPLLARWPKARWHPQARIFHLPQGRPRAGRVAVTCAGTSDLPVAEEAALTAEAMGATVARIYDVGWPVCTACSGGGARSRRPTSRWRWREWREPWPPSWADWLASGGGGADQRRLRSELPGLSALLTMLNSCASNVAVVNIDNGFGAGFYAALVSRSALRMGRER
jgi:NCAIR mutase (PurE)-related protein